MRKQIHPVVAGLVVFVLLVVAGLLLYVKTTPRLPANYVPSRERVKEPKMRAQIMDAYKKKWENGGQ
jgi:hypothetical protein